MPSKPVQPRIAEPILSQDQGEPGPEWKRGSGVRKGSLVLYRGRERYVYDLRVRKVHSQGIPCWPEDMEAPLMAWDPVKQQYVPNADTYPANECHRLAIKEAVTYVKIAEGWVPFSQVSLKCI